MKVLVACEESQVVTKALRNLGIEAWSCDVLPTSGANPEWHLQQDVTPLLSEQWDMIVAFPPCTDLAVSGARWFAEKRANGSQQRSIDFFMAIANAPCERIAIENPVGIMSSQWRKPDQIIQPWQFGHGETKATCLWLKNLPLLKPTCIVEGREQRIWKMPPLADRAKLRSKTYEGIALAMAEQWHKPKETIIFRQLGLFAEAA
jgi:site-specific DNA-cytosine methylase